MPQIQKNVKIFKIDIFCNSWIFWNVSLQFNVFLLKLFLQNIYLIAPFVVNVKTAKNWSDYSDQSMRNEDSLSQNFMTLPLPLPSFSTFLSFFPFSFLSFYVLQQKCCCTPWTSPYYASSFSLNFHRILEESPREKTTCVRLHFCLSFPHRTASAITPSVVAVAVVVVDATAVETTVELSWVKFHSLQVWTRTTQKKLSLSFGLNIQNNTRGLSYNVDGKKETKTNSRKVGKLKQAITHRVRKNELKNELRPGKNIET